MSVPALHPFCPCALVCFLQRCLSLQKSRLMGGHILLISILNSEDCIQSREAQTCWQVWPSVCLKYQVCLQQVCLAEAFTPLADVKRTHASLHDNLLTDRMNNPG